MNIKYRMKVYALSQEEGGGYFAEFPELPGCSTGAETLAELEIKAQQAIESWIEAAREMKIPIPEPKYYDSIEFSGKLTLRMPKNLHKELAEISEEQGVSINQLILYYLSKGIGSNSQISKENSPVNQQEIYLLFKGSRELWNNISDRFNNIQPQWGGRNLEFR